MDQVDTSYGNDCAWRSFGLMFDLDLDLVRAIDASWVVEPFIRVWDSLSHESWGDPGETFEGRWSISAEEEADFWTNDQAEAEVVIRGLGLMVWLWLNARIAQAGGEALPLRCSMEPMPDLLKSPPYDRYFALMAAVYERTGIRLSIERDLPGGSGLFVLLDDDEACAVIRPEVMDGAWDVAFFEYRTDAFDDEPESLRLRGCDAEQVICQLQVHSEIWP